MPIIYLSPSTQEWNMYVTGSGSEEYNMNLLADALVPYLLSNGIQYTRNTPDMTAASSVRQANQGYYDFYLALHSNAAPEGRYGEERGIIAFYYPGSTEGQRGAELIAEELRKIYPLPNRVTTRATTTLGEVRQPRFPAVLLEIGYHDNTADALWIQENIQNIAENLVQSLTEYFGLPFIYPMTPRTGTVITQRDALNVRSYPALSGQIVGSVPPQAQLTVYGQFDGWYSIGYGNLAGYVLSDFVQI